MEGGAEGAANNGAKYTPNGPPFAQPGADANNPGGVTYNFFSDGCAVPNNNTFAAPICPAPVVPEPSSLFLTMIGTGIAGLAAGLRRKL